MDDVLLNKASIIERCIRRVREEFAGDAKRLENFTHQDAIVLNLERACQAAIDMAMRVVAERHLGAPQNSAQAFDLLAQAGLIPGGLAEKLRAMVGFRNVAVHQYRSLDMSILQLVIERGPDDLASFCSALGARIKP
ncbi:MAG: DUF86 domain-containing protein [Elusimicrobia bacterium]|nr:DUF86 domain-containing protein [Elusimicrobiota bacterium]